MANELSRKKLLGVLGAAAAATTLSDCAPAQQSSATAGSTAAPPVAQAHALGSEPEAYVFFTAPERAFVEAAVDRLIPPDDLGPGGKEAGVAFYIDQQLSGAFGYGARMYRQGPFAPGIPEQGPQSPLNPREIYRLGIAAADDHCRKAYSGKTFAELSTDQMDATLSAMEKGSVQFDAVPAGMFFEALYANTIEGFFADPLYGGNRDMAGWKLVGFPGVAAAYVGVIETYNKPYLAAPVSIAGEQQQADAMSTGHQPLHTLAMQMNRRAESEKR
jgi:gluconate 2-dehydrogenase gamma chain